MQSLFEYLESIYKQLPSLVQLDLKSFEIISSSKFKDLIDDDKKCIELISSVLEFSTEAIFMNRHRASHIIVTWVLGVGLSNFVKNGKVLTGFFNLNETRLWLQTAIVHDYGYFCREIKSMLPLETITKDYDLLTDTYYVDELRCLNGLSIHPEFRCFFLYDYNEIKNYYLYIQSWHRDMMKNSISDNKSMFDDVSDHGIVGGCKAFSRYCKHITSLKNDHHYGSSDVITKIQKISCIIAASHNIFKSNTKEKDEKYIEARLENRPSTSPVSITKANFLLLLLSLVDTIECTKRFSKKENPNEYLVQSTVLSRVDINVKENEIQVDFDRLDRFILNERKSASMSKKLERHIEAIVGLEDWTDFHATRSVTSKKAVIVSFK